jgi:hypothetical protein
MKRLLALSLCMASVAGAQAYYPYTQEPPGTAIYARGYGVQADGVTSDDVALKAAADACNAVGGHLILPPGTILLDGTGGNSVALDGCWMEGTGTTTGRGISGAGSTSGTTFNVTSTSVAPFKLGAAVKISNFNIWYPNQTTGAVVYPATFTDGGANGWSHVRIEDINCLNAWICFKTTQNSGDVQIFGGIQYAAHAVVSIGANTGDSWLIDHVRYTDGGWLSRPECYSNACLTQINQASSGNAIWEETGGSAWVVINNVETFNFRYGLYVGASGNWASGSIDANFDGTATLVDSSANSSSGFPIQNNFTGSASTCVGITRTVGGVVQNTTPTSCFNLGSGSGIYLHNFRLSASSGSFLVGAGTNTIKIENLQLPQIGSVLDGGDYYFLNFTGTNNTVRVYDSNITGYTSGPDAHEHGINFTQTNPFGTPIVLQNIAWNYMTDLLTVNANSPIMLTGNISTNTGATNSITQSGAGAVYNWNNSFDKPVSILIQAPISRASNVICNVHSATATLVTGGGTGTETNVASCKVPRKTLGAQGSLRITTFWARSAAGTNTITYFVRGSTTNGGTSGGVAALNALTNAVSGNIAGVTISNIYNTATNAQLAVLTAAAANGAPTGFSSAALLTAAADTDANDYYVNFNCANTTSTADSCGVYGYVVEAMVP